MLGQLVSGDSFLNCGKMYIDTICFNYRLIYIAINVEFNIFSENYLVMIFI